MNTVLPSASSGPCASTVLVVDDEPLYLRVLGELLQPHYAVRVANSAERAWSALATEPVPDLILLDVLMPDMDGFELLRRIKGRPETRDIPVIFLTMLNDEDSEQRGLELGAADYLHKPLKSPLVLSRIRAQLEARSARELLRKNNLRLKDQVSQGARALEQAQARLLQMEKMAALGQLAAGIAHEINNPIGYVSSNLGTLENYVTDLLRRLKSLPGAAQAGPDADLEFMREDLPKLLHESREGIARVRKIVQDLKDFSRGDEKPDWQWADLNQGIESTLNIVNNELKYKAEVVKHYGQLPAIQCMATQLNQVVLNLLVNAAQAIDARGRITISTGCEADRVWFEVADTGGGIEPEVLERIFEPFYTTKPPGQGTGLGLSISYGIVQKHHGSINVTTQPGQGTTFRVSLPCRQPDAA